jgi:hypothetical protein
MVANPEAEALTMQQRVFVGVLGFLSVLLAALVLLYFSPVEETSGALPGQHLLPAVYEGSVRSRSKLNSQSDREIVGPLAGNLQQGFCT